MSGLLLGIVLSVCNCLLLFYYCYYYVINLLLNYKAHLGGYELSVSRSYIHNFLLSNNILFTFCKYVYDTVVHQKLHAICHWSISYDRQTESI